MVLDFKIPDTNCEISNAILLKYEQPFLSLHALKIRTVQISRFLRSVLKQLVCQKIFRTTDDLTAVILQPSLTHNTRLSEIGFLSN